MENFEAVEILLGRDEDWKEKLEAYIEELREKGNNEFVDGLLATYKEFSSYEKEPLVKKKCDFCGDKTFLPQELLKLKNQVSCTGCLISTLKDSDEMYIEE